MANLSDFLPAGGGGSLVNTYTAISVMDTTPGWDSSTAIYTDENGGKWLRTGTTLDLTPAVQSTYSQAGSKFYSHNNRNANATSGTGDVNGWTFSFIYEYNSISDFKFFAKKYRSYNNQQGFYSYNYPSAGTIIQHPPSNSTSVSTPLPYGYNPNNSGNQRSVTLVTATNDMLVKFYDPTNNDTTGATLATYTNGNLNNQNKVKTVYFDGVSANSNIHVGYVDGNALKLDIYTSNGSSYSLNTTKTLTTSSSTLTVPYSGDLGANLWTIEYNSSNGDFAVWWSNKIIYYSDENTISTIFAVDSGNDRSRVVQFDSTTLSTAQQAGGGAGNVKQWKSIIGESNSVSQSVLTGMADNLYVFKKIK